MSESERCPRCRRRVENHGTAIIDRRYRQMICPTTKGHAAKYNRSMDTGVDRGWRL